MAMIRCRECKSTVSSKAQTCPACGARVARKQYGCGTLIAFVLLLGLLFALFSGSESPGPVPEHGAQPEAAGAAAPVLPRPAEPLWSYSSDKDAMTGKVTSTAVTRSTNTFEFGFPYGGAQRATLTLRRHPSYGKDVIVSIERGQLLCPLDECSVTVRFDDGQPRTVRAAGAADHSTESIFLSGYDAFVRDLKRADVVRIQARVYQEGDRVFEFSAAGLDESRVP